ncbi:GerMN domain-containing protein [Neobacillus sp. CF12]|uniref:GerMN domain-containing protein n=1 Tax=Neobacillus sp. CF12 TaxID=3055864 RepID=UPI0025A1EEF0|nr:GerMN domain-containing protein [Neobacillus sp. CF12]MDM5330804.1 GerMN domain-containing protein [Neobacillus sp. CF12]
MSKNKVKPLVTAVFASTLLLSGCGLFGNEEQKKVDPPKQVTVTDTTPTKETTGKSEEVEGEVKTELYLINKDGYVVPQTLTLPKTTSVAKQALEHLVANGPVQDMLPNDFRAVLPEETQISVNIKDGVAVVDFSKEFKNYQPEDERKILESITWTLTQFDTIEKVKLQMNGHELTEMPVNGTPISENLSRTTGINLDTADVMDITNTKPVTVYYIGGEENAYYYVPVTKRVNTSEKNNIVAIVNELVKGPNSKSNLASEFMPDVELLEAPKIEDGKVTLNFNKSIYGSFEEKIVSEHLLNALVLSLTEQKGIESVAVTVDGKAELVNDKGVKLSEPVTRPEKVNTGSF